MSYENNSVEGVFNKDNIDTYLKELAKEYRKLVGKRMPAEIILIGGASTLINYGFRDMTNDMDVIFQGASAMKDAIDRVGDRMGLPGGWMNDDFRRTESYSSKIPLYSEYYRTFSNVVTIRTVTAEYLIAMKLRSWRQYKKDQSDVIGVLLEHSKMGKQITTDMIKKAVIDLYDDWEIISEEARQFLKDSIKRGDFEQQYKEVRASEEESRNILLKFEKDYPGQLNTSNVSDVLTSLKGKKEKPSVIAKLRENQKIVKEMEAQNNQVSNKQVHKSSSQEI